jgi:hypothetical protein
MKLPAGADTSYSITMDTHMGVLTGMLNLKQETEETVSGSLDVMGKNIRMNTCAYEPDVYSFVFEAMNLTVKLFLSVNKDESIYGFALAPHHQVMELRGTPVKGNHGK